MRAAELLAWRERLGLTQAGAAEALKTPLGTYRHWEQGARRVPGVAEVACNLLERERSLRA